MNEVKDVIVMDTAEVHVFDGSGKLLATLNDSQDFQFQYNGEDGRDSIISFNKALFSPKLIKLLEQGEESYLSDFDQMNKDRETATIDRVRNRKKLRLIARTLSYDPDNLEPSQDVRLIFPVVEFLPVMQFKMMAGKPMSPKYVFRVLPFNKDGDLVEKQFFNRAV